MSSRKSNNRNLAAIDRRIEQKIGKGQVITGIAEVVTEDGRAARVRLLGSGVLTDVAIVRGAQINPGDHVILLRPTDNDQWVCLGGYVRRVVSTQGSTTLSDLTGLSDPNNLQVIPGPGLLFLTWDSPAQRPDLTWFVQMAEIADNEWLNPITYSRGGSTLVVTGDPGEYRMFRIRAVDKNWNRSEWSGIASGAFGSTAVGSGSGGGASAFLDLTDTPSSYSSQALKYLRVASMENGVEFTTFPNHDHSGDAGDGGTFDAANLTSGAATDGHVLTADGAGGAAWEAAAGGASSRVSASLPTTYPSGQIVANNDYAALEWGTPNWDTDSFYSSGVPEYLTIPENGLYLVNARISATAAGAGDIEMWIFDTAFDMAMYDSVTVASGDKVTLSCSGLFDLTATEQLYVEVYQTTGANLVLSLYDGDCVFEITKVSS